MLEIKDTDSLLNIAEEGDQFHLLCVSQAHLEKAQKMGESLAGKRRQLNSDLSVTRQALAPPELQESKLCWSLLSAAQPSPSAPQLATSLHSGLSRPSQLLATWNRERAGPFGHCPTEEGLTPTSVLNRAPEWAQKQN